MRNKTDAWVRGYTDATRGRPIDPARFASKGRSTSTQLEEIDYKIGHEAGAKDRTTRLLAAQEPWIAHMLGDPTMSTYGKPVVGRMTGDGVTVTGRSHQDPEVQVINVAHPEVTTKVISTSPFAPSDKPAWPCRRLRKSHSDKTCHGKDVPCLPGKNGACVACFDDD